MRFPFLERGRFSDGQGTDHMRHQPDRLSRCAQVVRSMVFAILAMAPACGDNATEQQPECTKPLRILTTEEINLEMGTGYSVQDGGGYISLSPSSLPEDITIAGNPDFREATQSILQAWLQRLSKDGFLDFEVSDEEAGAVWHAVEDSVSSAPSVPINCDEGAYMSMQSAHDGLVAIGDPRVRRTGRRTDEGMRWRYRDFHTLNDGANGGSITASSFFTPMFQGTVWPFAIESVSETRDITDSLPNLP